MPVGSPLGNDDFADLDYAFELSDSVTDPKMRELYENLVQRMRVESRGVPMTGVQQLLIERIASNYIFMKIREQRSPAEGGYATPAAHKDAVTFWLAMTEAFNKTLKQKLPEAVKKEIFEEVKTVIFESLEPMKDARAKQAIVDRFSAALAKAGL